MDLKDDVASCAAVVKLPLDKQATAFCRYPSSSLMPISQYNKIKPGLPVSIVLKADQRSGRQVQGTVAQLLTRHNHPRGIKVKLTDGRVGRVQQILRDMGSNNPWADASSQGNPWQPSEQEQQSLNQTYFAQGNANQHQQSSYGQHPQAGHGQSGHQQNSQQQSDYQQDGFQAPPGPPPSQGLHRSDTEQLLAQQQDAGAQVETMQQYESNARQTTDDRAQADLQKQFPNLDSSLIAAIYNERKPDMAEVRELLQELNSS